MTRTARVVVAVATVVSSALGIVTAQNSGEIPRSHPAINYDQPANDPIAVMLRDPTMRARLESAAPPQLLSTLLDALSIPEDSQILVFLSASLQSSRINEGNPRALYFNDAVSVGWVRGGFIEIAAQDPTQGTVFYTAGASPGSVVVRENDRCLSCHHNGRTEGVPGMVERTGYTRPLHQRWGGWYVTGDLGPLRHLGNVDEKRFLKDPSVRAQEHLSSLERTFDTSGYLTPHSDVAALLVFEHQMQMMNLLTRIAWDTRVAKQEGRFDGTGSVIADRVEQVVDYMLFVNEASVPAKLQGSTPFAAAFSGRGPRDPKGRSLYQLDLETRLLRYPCSYMIYSEQFTQLPPEARLAIGRRLWRVLSGAERHQKYAHLSTADRTAIIEILRATKPDLSLGSG